MLMKLIRTAFRSPHSRAMSMIKAEIDPVQLSLLDESCILIDQDDNALGEASKKDCHAVGPNGELLLHRAFSVYLFNSKNELLLQKRSPYKITYPNHFTNTCCSHPLWSIAGEREEINAMGVRLAAQRRLTFELGIPPDQARPEDMRYITRIHYKDKGDGVWGEHEIDYILFLKCDPKLDINENEISEVRYVSLNKFDQFLNELKDPLTPWFNLISQNMMKYWWKNLHRYETFSDHQNIFRFHETLN